MPDEPVAGSPQPAPAKPSVDVAALEEYFQSIKEPFEETRAGLERDNKGISGIIITLFIFSLIPLIPFAVSKVAWRYFGSTLVSVWTIHFHVASFWFWWVVFFSVSLAVLLIAGKLSGVRAEDKKKWLSPPQMRFAYCYAVVNEIGRYKTNQLPRHIEAALNCLDKTAASLLPSSHVPIDVYPEQYWRREIEFSVQQAVGIEDALPRPPKWYRLRPETESILRAFGEFKRKLRDRLKDRKDLPAIETALTFLAAYQYLEIPELSDSKSEARFEEGMESLLTFASQLTALPPYRSEELKQTPKEKFSLKFFALLLRLTAPFSHDNPVVAFFAWLVLLFPLFMGGFYVALRLFAIKVDSTVITTLVGGPILGALTAVTIPRVGRKKSE